VVRELVDRYKQPALVEEYISGREFTVGMLGDRRPRVLPPMEIIFKDRSNKRPVYDYDVKQAWTEHVYYHCPAKLTPQELKAVERAARETFQALDCRDVARVDLRMNDQGQVYVLEVNPLPGLTPDYSDLVLISKAAAMDYRTLIAEILAGGLKRLREKRREGGAMNGSRSRASAVPPPPPPPIVTSNPEPSSDDTSAAPPSPAKVKKARPRPTLESQVTIGSAATSDASENPRRRLRRAEKDAVR
jgi:D-alanine-D-alanine ligase